MQASASNAATQILSAAESPGIPLEMQQTANKAVSEALRTADVMTTSAIANTNTKVTKAATASAVSKKVVSGVVKETETEKKKISVEGNVKDMQQKAGTSAPR
jgi:galactitol-specific phosphotransferase system IIB component